MSGTKAGGQKASRRIKEIYGEDFYKIQGAKGGKKTGVKGFATNHDLAVEAGKKGGTISRRGRKNG